MTLDALSGEAAVLALEMARTTGLVLATPILFSSAPARVRGAIVVVLGLVCHATGVRPADGLDSFEKVAIAAPTEMLLGAAMGLVVRFALAAVEVVGDVISPLLGLGAATLFDPHTETHETGLTRLLRMLMMLLALLLGIHRVLIAALIQSFRAIPVGSLVDPSLAAPELVRISGAALAAGVRMAIPVLAVLLLLQIGLGFLSRAAPSLQIFSIGFAVTLIAGGVVIFTSLPELARELERELSRTGSRIESVLDTMTRS
jgi:flagellar biosynthetic protein FliR